MITNLSTQKWHSIIIPDPNALPGKSIFDILNLLIQVIPFKFVILDDIVRASINNLISILQERENEIIELDELMRELCDIIQFDWGDFFLFKFPPDNWEDVMDLKYPGRIMESDTTVRAVDDTYIYVYTPFKQIADVIKENYVIESVTIDFLQNLKYPS